MSKLFSYLSCSCGIYGVATCRWKIDYGAIAQRIPKNDHLLRVYLPTQIITVLCVYKANLVTEITLMFC